MSKILYTGAGMTYEERGQVVYLVASVGGFAAYVVLLAIQADGIPLTEVDYVPTMLWVIGLGIVASIIGRIAIEIGARIREEMSHQPEGITADIRDQEIGRFGEYVSGIVLGVGMVVPFILAITEADYFWIANSMYFVFVLAAVVGAAIKLIAYRRGF
jgi:hypothetical protein